MAKDLRKLESEINTQRNRCRPITRGQQLLTTIQMMANKVEISEQAKYSVSALYKWRHHNRDFIAYANELSADVFNVTPSAHHGETFGHARLDERN
ncbi:hypothetical protein [Brevibacillus laterosporus]|uniref:hypothetical protein n=1 Tax=Brevibacillus laterosporus TaxID=1465 RepID=UPI001EF27294|nr:hypothetical protein [Brevibacillus laterosporus]MCG7318567.1 hypothetical protein [Brevibacillus laterosporus]MED1788768.1 hypothetical protein [Brevibacillus laterosporus]